MWVLLDRDRHQRPEAALANELDDPVAIDEDIAAAQRHRKPPSGAGQ